MEWLASWCGYLRLPGTEQLLRYAAYSLVTVLYYPNSLCNDKILIHQNVFFPSVIFWHVLLTTVAPTFQQYDYIALNIMVDNIYSSFHGNLGSASYMLYYTAWFHFIMTMGLSYEHFPWRTFIAPYLTTEVPQAMYHWMPIETEGKISSHVLYNEGKRGPRTV
jgi:hypothetical protein